MIALLWPLIRPFLGYIIGVAALIGIASGFYFKVKHDAIAAEKAKIEQEKADAIKKGNEARDHVRLLCGANLSLCPAEWFRD